MAYHVDGCWELMTALFWDCKNRGQMSNVGYTRGIRSAKTLASFSDFRYYWGNLKDEIKKMYFQV